MPQKYKTGDIVQLKSGGPKMTVKEYSTAIGGVAPSYVVCQWFAGNKQEQGGFPEESLKLVQVEP